jgi:putative endonuclease
MLSSFEKGIRAEAAAGAFLRKNNYEIIANRYKTKYGEIDILAKKDQTYYIIEVKKRKNLTKAIESIGKIQMQRCINSFFHFVQENNIQNHENVVLATIFISPNELTMQILSEDFLEG